MSAFRVIIPARYHSTRFPGKLLKRLAGKPIIEHTYEQACQSAAATVVIATDDPRIAEVANGFGAAVVMTKSTHLSGTDRLAEAVTSLAYADDDIIVNVQGDEPLIPPMLINQVAMNLNQQPQAVMATLSWPITHAAELFDPHIVKVVCNQQNFALYFSRAAIPWERDEFCKETLNQLKHCFRHVGIYAYRVNFLQQYVRLPPATLEVLEQLEQLRALAYGFNIHVAQALVLPPADVNTVADLEKILATL